MTPIARILRERIGAYTVNVQSGPGFCSICSKPIDPGYSLCQTCHRRIDYLDRAVLLAYANDNPQTATMMRGYKEVPHNPHDARQVNIALMLSAAFRLHRPCIEYGLPAITSYVVIPSTRERPHPHPLSLMVESTFSGSFGLTELHASASGSRSSRTIDPKLFTLRTALPSPEHVLVIDDTWTTGSNAQSMALALKSNYGAKAVSALIAARWLDSPGRWRYTDLLVESTAHDFYDAGRCPVLPQGECMATPEPPGTN
jgi:predicted amidophosphoribosyltransferase